MRQVDIEEVGQTVTARQAAGLAEQGAEWVVQRVGVDGYHVGANEKGVGYTRWVRPVNGREPTRFASLDTASAWLRTHARVSRFRVHEGA